ncbi:hypothetical protein RQP46_008835 [Phenoliferia psychrophenolica]
MSTTSSPTSVPTFPPFPCAGLLDVNVGGAPHGDWRDQLATDGFCVVKDAIPREKALELLDRAHGWMESLGHGYKRDDPKTFRHETLPFNIKGGMMHSYGISHEDWNWETRTAPGVVGAFAKVWGTDELITSFDAGCIMLPYRTDVKDTARWEHIDQSPSRDGFYCLQGIVNLNDNGPQDGGLMALKGSNQLMKQYFDETGGREEIRTWGLRRPVDRYDFKPEQLQWFYDHGCEWVKVEADAGSLILFDSRCMHFNVRPTGDRERVCTYVCMAPARFFTEEDRQIRAEAFTGHRGTTHVPFGAIYTHQHTPAIREDSGLPDPLDTGIPKKPVVATKQVLQLVGIEAY